MADQPVMTGEQVLLVSFQDNAYLDSGHSSQVIYAGLLQSFIPFKLYTVYSIFESHAHISISNRQPNCLFIIFQ